MELLVVESSDSLTHLSLAGSLNLSGVQAVELQFLARTAAAQKPAIVDLSRVDFIASLGLRMILEAARSLRRNGNPLILLRPTADVENVLHISAISTIAIISHNEEDARSIASAF